ncbi:MAG: RNA methyltransferase [Cyclobacteriaceae bacterium]
MSVTSITSTSNPKIKNLKLLQKSKERKQQNLFVIEGLKEIEKATNAGIKLRQAFYCLELIDEVTLDKLIGRQASKMELFEVSNKVFNHIAYREDSGGILVTAIPKSAGLDDFLPSENPFFVVVESVEKPGNLGALLRTSDAAGIDGLIVCDPKTDIYNPNVIRSSIGCVFTVPTFVVESQAAIDWLQDHDINIYGAALTASKPYHQVDFKKPSAIVMGTESTGLSDSWLKNSTQNIIIPMRGVADSMNVSTSAAVLVFEAIRQRTA